MTAPSWLADTAAAVMVVVAVYCAGRLVASPVRRRTTERDTDVAHIAMGVAMAGMLVPPLDRVPSSVWEMIFAAAAAWFGWQVVRDGRGRSAVGGSRGRGDARRRGLRGWLHGHRMPHVVHSVAMLYMLLAARTSMAAGGGPTAGVDAMGAPSAPAVGFPTLTVVLALVLLGYAVWDADRLTARAAADASFAAAPPTVRAGRDAPNRFRPVISTDRAAAETAGSAAGQHTCAAVAPMLAPRLAACCRIVLGITMAYMLITML